MSISPMSAGAAKGTEFNDASTAQSAPSTSSSLAFSWSNPAAAHTNFTFGAANPASNPASMPGAGEPSLLCVHCLCSSLAVDVACINW